MFGLGQIEKLDKLRPDIIASDAPQACFESAVRDVMSGMSKRMAKVIELKGQAIGK